MIILVSFLVCVIGALVYALSANPKMVEMGRIAYGVGLLVTLLQVSSEIISLLGQ